MSAAGKRAPWWSRAGTAGPGGRRRMGWLSGLAASLDGLWFLSLHADELATVLGARAFTGSLPLGGHERGSRLLGHLPVTPTLPANGRPRHCGATRRTASCRRAGGAGPLPDRTVASVHQDRGPRCHPCRWNTNHGRCGACGLTNSIRICLPPPAYRARVLLKRVWGGDVPARRVGPSAQRRRARPQPGLPSQGNAFPIA